MELKLRAFREDDIPDIIEISKTTWEGHDHLPGMLDHWLSDSNCKPFVMEIDGTVISVANLKIIDQGQTGWMEGLRVHPEFREKGLAAQMTKHLVKIAKEHKLLRLRLVTATESPAPRKLAESVGMKAIGQYSVFWKGYRRNFRWTHDTESIVKMDKDDIIDFIKTHSELVPNNCLVYHWDIYDLTQQNVAALAEKAEFWYSEGQNGASLSLGFVHQSRYGLEWCFTIYASSPESFLSNLSFHLHHSRAQNIQLLMCIHPPEFQEQYKQVKWLKRRNHGIQLLLFERVL